MENQIRERAHQIYRERLRFKLQGDEKSDWFQAEKIVRQELARRNQLTNRTKRPQRK